MCGYLLLSQNPDWDQKLAKLGDAIAISKSETINHSLTDWQIEIGGDVLRILSSLSGKY